MALVVKSNIKRTVRDLQKGDEQITSVADEVGTELEIKVEELLERAIKRAKENKRRTIQARDL